MGRSIAVFVLAVAVALAGGGLRLHAEGASLWEREEAPPELRAQNVPGLALPRHDRARLERAVDIRIHPRCLKRIGSLAPEAVAEALAGFFYDAVAAGLERLDARAPSVSDEALAGAAGKLLILTCVNDDATLGYKGRTVDLQDAINISHFKRAAFTALSRRDASGELRELLRERGLLMTEPELVDMQATAFHEFLHFARLDNLTAAEHNRVGAEGLERHKADRVYSCEYVAFPPNGRTSGADFLDGCLRYGGVPNRR